ncbi:hypothetical protein ABE493_01030 [Stenotrophomonas terrae]|uniref:hypothetical protein n=1 Tax=Stenotrophomonas terrae TaxID=405446 RepID=UPI003207A90A
MKYRNAMKKFGSTYGPKIKGAYGKAATAIGSTLFTGLAFAQDGLGAEALTEVSGIRADVSAILKVLIGIVFLLVAFMYLKRAK